MKNLDVKRFFVPGSIIQSTCPECGEVVRIDMAKHYLSYPTTGEQDYTMWHSSQEGPYWEHTWEVRINLVVKIEAIEGCMVESR